MNADFIYLSFGLVVFAIAGFSLIGYLESTKNIKGV